jgi:hypothetical protein
MLTKKEQEAENVQMRKYFRTIKKEFKPLGFIKSSTWTIGSNPNSSCGSFSVTVIHDGTYVLSGDYGDLYLRARTHPKGGIAEMISWAAELGETNIRYFTDKMGPNQTFKEWNEKKALKEAKRDIMQIYELTTFDLDRYEELCDAKTDGSISDKMMEKFPAIEFLSNLSFETPESMLNQLRDFDSDIEWYESEYGWDYTSFIKHRFQCFRLWAKIASRDLSIARGYVPCKKDCPYKTKAEEKYHGTNKGHLCHRDRLLRNHKVNLPKDYKKILATELPKNCPRYGKYHTKVNEKALRLGIDII